MDRTAGPDPSGRIVLEQPFCAGSRALEWFGDGLLAVAVGSLLVALARGDPAEGLVPFLVGGTLGVWLVVARRVIVIDRRSARVETYWRVPPLAWRMAPWDHPLARFDHVAVVQGRIWQSDRHPRPADTGVVVWAVLLEAAAGPPLAVTRHADRKEALATGDRLAASLGLSLRRPATTAS